MPDTAETADPASMPVVLYWRPGCRYCSALRRRLRRLGVRTTEVNIWTDPGAAAVVRGVAGGNETVPTVVIGRTALVNPTGAQVLEAARRLAPNAVDDTVAGRSPVRSGPALLARLRRIRASR